MTKHIRGRTGMAFREIVIWKYIVLYWLDSMCSCGSVPSGTVARLQVFHLKCGLNCGRLFRTNPRTNQRNLVQLDRFCSEALRLPSQLTHLRLPSSETSLLIGTKNWKTSPDVVPLDCNRRCPLLHSKPSFSEWQPVTYSKPCRVTCCTVYYSIFLDVRV